MVCDNLMPPYISTHSMYLSRVTCIPPKYVSVIHFKLLYYYVAVPPMVTVIQPLPIVVGTTIELICMVTGIDPPRITTWTFNDTVIYTGAETAGVNISREISSIDYGIYTYSASNEFGSSSRAIEILPAGTIAITDCIINYTLEDWNVYTVLDTTI